MTADAPPPWEQQRDESAKAFAAFRLYRNQPPDERSQRQVAEELGKSGALMARWSSRHEWVTRAAAWDAEQDRQWQRGLAQKRRKAAERHLQMAQLAQARISHRLLGLNPDTMSVTELTRLFEVAVRVERDVLGEPTRHEVSGPGGDPIAVQIAGLASMTPEQRRQEIRRLTESVQRRSDAAAAVDDE